MGNPTKIDVANKNFDQLYEDLQPQLEKMSGKTCYARYDADKGLRIKDGIDNFLRLNKIMDKRGKKFADATEIFKEAINRQYPGEMVGEKTLGEHLLQDVMKDHGNGDRISAPEIKELYEKLHAHADKRNLDAATPNPAAFSTVASSRLVQSDVSIEAGKALLRAAVAEDLSEHPYYDGNLAGARARADKILEEVDLRGGLNRSSHDAIATKMATGYPSVVGGEKMADLRDLLYRGLKINTAVRQISHLNAALSDFTISREKRPALDKAVNELRVILKDLGKLSFPGDLDNVGKIRNLAKRLEQNYVQLSEATSEIKDPDSTDQMNAYLHQVEQGAEILGLAAALRNYAGYDNETDGVVVNHGVLSTYDLEDSLEGLSDAQVIVPKTLWTAPTRQGNDTFSDVARAYSGALQESQDLWHDFHYSVPKPALEEIEYELTRALMLNDAMLEGFERAEAVRGDRAFSEEIADHSLYNTKMQRVKLNVQLVDVRVRMQKESQRAPNQEAPPSVTDSKDPSAEPAIKLKSAAHGREAVSGSRWDYSADAKMKPLKYDDDTMTLRRVPLEASYDHIPEAHLNTLSQSGKNAPRRVVIDDPTKSRAGRFATSGQSILAHQSPDTTGDGRTRIKDILNEAALSRAGGLKNPDEASMKVASAPASPRNPLQSPAGNAAQKTPDVSLLNLDSVPASGPNPDDSSFNIQSAPPSPDHQPVSPDTVPASGANPEDSSFNIQSAPPSPNHQPEDRSLNEFASIDGAIAGAEIDADLYGAGYDASNGDRVNKESSSDIGSDDEEDGSVQLP